MATSVRERPPLEAELGARRTAEQSARLRRLHWFDLATSLWTPITVLALALIPYLIVVESWPSTAPGALPIMQRFGLAMVLWFGSLVAWRLVDRRGASRRRLRHEARELTGELSHGLDTVHDPAARERLVEQAARVDAAAATGDAVALEKEVRSLSDQATRLVPAFRKQNTISIAVGLGKALAVALLIRAILIEPFRIPSGSMLPTLQIGDQIFVNKFIYGVHIPWANVVPFVIVRPPRAGDVIVFENPVTGEDYIKRVVGVPGDVLEFREDGVRVNGHVIPAELEQTRVSVWEKDDGNWYQEFPQLWREHLGGGTHEILLNERKHQEQPGGLHRVPPRSVLVMGDNRDNSTDSRFGLSPSGPRRVVFVPYGNIKGKAMIIWLSLSHGGLLSDLFGGTGLRADRFFQQVR